MSTLSKQKSVSANLMLELRRFIAGVILFNQQVAEQVGMNPTDMQCIHLLQLMGPVTAGKLAELTRLTTGGVTVALDRLEKARLVRRERNPHDRRSILVHLEPKTLARIEAIYAEIGARTEALLANLPEKKLDIVLEFFLQMNSLRNAPGAGRSPVAPARHLASNPPMRSGDAPDERNKKMRAPVL